MSTSEPCLIYYFREVDEDVLKFTLSKSQARKAKIAQVQDFDLVDEKTQGVEAEILRSPNNRNEGLSFFDTRLQPSLLPTNVYEAEIPARGLVDVVPESDQGLLVWIHTFLA